MIRIFLALLLLPQLAFAGAYSTTRNATSCTNVAGGGFAWTTPNNAATENATYATNTLNAAEISDYLNCFTGAFSFGTGQTITVTGVMCETLGAADVSDEAQITAGWLSANSVQQGSSVASGNTYSTTEAWGEKGTFYGGDGEMFGLTAAQMLTLVTGKFFGCQFWIEDLKASPPVNLQIDAVRVTVYYDIAAKTLPAMGAGK